MQFKVTKTNINVPLLRLLSSATNVLQKHNWVKAAYSRNVNRQKILWCHNAAYLIVISEAVVVNIWKQARSRPSITTIQTATNTALQWLQALRFCCDLSMHQFPHYISVQSANFLAERDYAGPLKLSELKIIWKMQNSTSYRLHAVYFSQQTSSASMLPLDYPATGCEFVYF